MPVPGRTAVLRGVCLIAVSMLFIAGSCKSDFLTDAGPSCESGRFKCDDPGLKPVGANTCGPTCQCILDRTQFVGTSVVYVCLQPNGSLTQYVTDRLEDLSAYESRNNLTCVSKIRCTR